MSQKRNKRHAGVYRKRPHLPVTLTSRCKASVRAVFFSTRRLPSEVASLEARSLYWKNSGG